MTDRPDVPESARVHVLWQEVGQQADQLTRLENATHARIKAVQSRVDTNAERIEDLRLWRAKLMGAILAAGGLGGGIGAAVARIFGGG